MRPQDIKIGEYYRHIVDSNYGWAKALEILKPKQRENYNTYTVVRCEWTIHKGDSFGYIKYFRPCDLVREERV
jgi:hypothetical protein